jgi:cell division protein FtsQ
MLVLIASLGGLLYIATAPRFVVRDIRVLGAQTLPAQVIADMSAARDQSIWFVDTGKIAERLQANAYIERADAYLALPDKLTISVAERRAELRWRSGDKLYLLDASGRVLSSDDSAPLTDTLVIEDRSHRELEPNDMVDPLALKLGRAVALRLPAELHLMPAAIGWDSDNGIVVTTTDSRTIIFGRGEDIDGKLEILATLLSDGTPFTLLDLRPSTPYYRNDTPGKPAAPTPTPEPEQ